MWPLLFKDLQGSVKNDINTRHVSTYLNEGKVQLIDIGLLLPKCNFIRCYFHGDSNDKIPNSYQDRWT